MVENISCAADTEETQQIAIAKQEMDAFPFWYHRIALPNGLVTPGWAPILANSYQIPADLTGKRVLDIGAWDGYWTFEALRRGAKEVVAIDDFSDYLGDLPKEHRNEWATFDWCRRQLGYSPVVCQRKEMSIYEISEATLGRFDIVFFFGTLYHLRYPLLALDMISMICDQQLYIESAIADDYSPYRGGAGQGHTDQMVMEFYPGSEYGNNPTNWWAPTLKCLAHMSLAAGFKNTQSWKLMSDPTHIGLCRGFVIADKN